MMNENLITRIKKLKLYGLAERWSEYEGKEWIAELVKTEEDHRHRRGLAQRLKAARLGDFRPIAEFDWSWPKKINRAVVEELLTLGFMAEKENIALLGSNGVGKTLIAKNIAFEAIRVGKRAKFMDASEMLTQLSRAESTGNLSRALASLTLPDLLIIDEIGQVSFGDRHADLFFALINRRYLKKSTIITTNIEFGQWGSLFPNATCVVTLVDRLLHRAEIVDIEGNSFRLRESQERQQQKQVRRSQKRS
jgi:DNA replication protein DnaC